MIFHKGQMIQSGYGFGGSRTQYGRGIGSFFSGILRRVAPLAAKGARVVGKALTSSTAKKIANDVKDAAVDTGLNLITNSLEGKDANEGLQNDFKKMKKDVVNNIKRIKRRKKYDLLSEESDSDEPKTPVFKRKKGWKFEKKKIKKRPNKKRFDILSESETENSD